MADTIAGGTTLDNAATATNPSAPSHNDELKTLIARATAAYAIKDYSPAAELYAEAAELQAEMNGEMAIENADLLYSYGKCLYFVARNNSDVLGGNAPKTSGSDKKPTKKRKLNGESSKAALATSSSGSSSKLARDGITGPVPLADVLEEGAADVIPESDLTAAPQPTTAQSELQEIDPSKPYFQFEGDDKGWDDSDEEDGDGDNTAEGAEEAEEEEDDFANAFEVLDLARVLLLRKLDTVQQSTLESSDKGKYVPSIDLTPEVREIKNRIADVHDLQAEISLEGEKFSNAVVDLKAALALYEELLPIESEYLAECHFKLSLALEFSSVHQQQPQALDNDGQVAEPEGPLEFDEAVRQEAAEQMEKAIQSCKLRIEKEEQDLIISKDDEKKKHEARAKIDDVKDMVTDMEQRLVELRKPPVSVKEAEKADVEAQNAAMSGILGQILGGGKSKEEQKKMLEEAASGAKDLSGLVKRKKPKANGEASSANMTPEPSGSAVNGNGKRKVEFADVVEEMGTGKKAKVEDAEDAE